MLDAAPRPRLSIVSTLYRSEPFVDDFLRRSIAAAENITGDFEIVLVNDGSPDASLDRALAWQRRDPRIVVIDLSRNFGHHKAMMTGIECARGDFVFILDSDLEEEPELLHPFWERLAQGDCDVVHGVQTARRGGMVERATGAFYYYLVSAMSDLPVPANLITARLMTRRYVNELLRHRDQDFVMSSLWALTGFRQIAMPVTKNSTKKSSYSIHRRVDAALNFLTAHSTKIVYLFLYTGLLIASLSTLYVVFLIVRYIALGTLAEGWTSVMVSIWLFGGMTMFLLGMIGVYVSKILIETRQRPRTVIREIYSADRSESAPIAEGAAQIASAARERL